MSDEAILHIDESDTGFNLVKPSDIKTHQQSYIEYLMVFDHEYFEIVH